MAVHSNSSLSTFEQCPRQYFYKYVERIEVPEEAVGVACFLGSRVHEVLEHLYRELMRGVVITKPNLVRYYSRRWEDAWSDDVDLHGQGSVAGWRDLGRECMETYYERHQPFKAAETIDVEALVRFRLDDKGKHEIVGYIDRIARRADGTWEIHDYKSGRGRITQQGADEDRQLALYELGLRAMHPDAGAVDLIWHDLRHDEQVTSRRTPVQLEMLRDRTSALIDDIESRDGVAAFPASESPLCGWCAYRANCPEGREYHPPCIEDSAS